MPFGRIVDAGIPLVLNKDGSIQTTFKYRGPDLDSATSEQLSIITAQLNNALMGFGSDYCLWFEAQRVPSLSYATDVYFPDPLTREIDERRKKWFQNGNHFESNYFLTLYWMPPSDTQGRLENLAIEGQTRKLISSDENIETFKEAARKFEMIFQGVQIPCDELTMDELVTYLHSTVSSSFRKVTAPTHPMLVDSYLYDDPYYGGFLPRIGNKFIRVVVPMSFLGHSVFGIFDALNRVNFSYRWVTRFKCMDKQDSLKELKDREGGWRNKAVTLMSVFKEWLNGFADPNSEDTVALDRADEAKAAANSVEADEVGFGVYSTGIVILDDDSDMAEEKGKFVVNLFGNLGMDAQIEKLNAQDAWLGMIPGMISHHARRPLLSTVNLVQMLPISNVWAGPERNNFLKAPVLLYTQTDGNTPFRLSLHVNDVGHTFLVGPTGAGKSVHLNMITSAFRKYKDARIYIFDKGASSYVLTQAVGGEFYDLGAEDRKLSFQPLSKIDSDIECQWAQGWLTDFAEANHQQVDPEMKKKIWETLLLMRAFPPKLRTISNFIDKLQDTKMKMALSPLSIRGAYGRMFDAEEDNLSFNSWQSFEMDRLTESPGIISPTLMYIFHRIEEDLKESPRPTLIVLDECWSYFEQPVFAEKIRKWLKELRKYKASVIFATQSISDISKSSIFATIIESCFSQIYLPNDRVYEENNHKLYTSFGLNEQQIRIIAEAEKKKYYYYTSPMGSRKYDLALDDLALAFCAATDKSDVQKAEQLIRDYGKENFVEKWKEYKGVA